MRPTGIAATWPYVIGPWANVRTSSPVLVTLKIRIAAAAEKRGFVPRTCVEPMDFAGTSKPKDPMPAPLVAKTPATKVASAQGTVQRGITAILGMVPVVPSSIPLVGKIEIAVRRMGSVASEMQTGNSVNAKHPRPNARMTSIVRRRTAV